MQSLSATIKPFLDWVSFSGRINRRDFWLCYAFPGAITLALSGIAHVPLVGLFGAVIIASGLKKRSNDCNFKLDVQWRRGSLALWGVVSAIALFGAFVLFLGGISGMGNSDLLTWAVVLACVPFVPGALVPLVVALKPGLPEATEFGPPPEGLSLGTNEFISFAVVVAALFVSSVGFRFAAGISGESRLIQAINEDRIDRVRRELYDGADPNQSTSLGTTALMLALEKRGSSQLLAEPLLEKGADPNAVSVLQSEAEYAFQAGGREAIQSLDRHTPLVYVLSRGSSYYPWFVELMLEMGADASPDPAHPGEPSPLVVASRKSNIAVLELLLAHGASASDERNHAAFTESLEQYDLDVFFTLLKSGLSLVQLEDGIARLDALPDSGSRIRRLPTVRQYLEEAVNDKLGTEKFPYRQHFAGQVREMVAETRDGEKRPYREQSFRKPIKVRSESHISFLEGPHRKSEQAGQLFAGQELEAIAITNLGYESVWYRIRDRQGKEGYVWGSHLCSLGVWYRGMSYKCVFPDE